ncbi:MAG: hypothetical protein HYY06_16420 [Deltaproteobacteria bacterium]|nr:hypothetical protein [Deltaproteobacteria bacterium]
MKWLKRIAVGLGLFVLVAALAAGVFYWRMRSEPDFMEGAPVVQPSDAKRIVEELARETRPEPPRRSADGEGRRPRPSVPYRLALNERQVTALVVSGASGHLGGEIGDLTVRIRERDLVAAGRLRTTALAGSVVSLAAKPGVGARGRLCLALGRPMVGGQEIPEELIRELGGQGAVPRRICVSARGAGLPGPLRSIRVAGGSVIVEGTR